MPALDIQNLEVKPGWSDCKRMIALFTSGDARYHVWFDPATLQLTDRVLYKNPIVDTPRSQCRQLDPNNATNAPTIAALFKLVVDLRLVEATVAQFNADRAQKEREAYVRSFVAQFWAAKMRGQHVDLPANIGIETFNETSLLAQTIFPT